MGTRGLTGITKNGKDYFSYNHFDSYPDGLGVSVLAQIPEILKNQSKVDLIKLISKGSGSSPTHGERCQLREYSNFSVGERSENDWYCVLRDLQGDILGQINAGYMIDSFGFATDSLFCEWGYVINLDTNKLEVYEGFQKSPPHGRFSDYPADNGYYAIGLVAEFDLDDLPDKSEFIQVFS